MGRMYLRPALVAFSATVGLLAQTPADSRAAVEAAAAKQRAAAALQQESVARQRASVEKQTKQASQSPFFVLPPPAVLDATVAAFAPLAEGCDSLPAAEVDALVEGAARRQDLEKETLRSVMRQESAFRPCALSPKGAMGLMQLMPATAIQFGVANPFDPAGNVEAGATFLKQLLVRYGGDLTLALGAYNAGPAKVDAAVGIPKIPETQEYVKDILSTLPVKQ